MRRAAETKLRALRDHLNETLFPDPLARPASRRWGARAAIAVAFLAIGTLLSLTRPGWSVSFHSIWAEDGSVFLHGALTQSFGETVFAPYANYLVLVPRLIGEAATVVPLSDAPAAISVLSAAMISLSGLVVWHATAGHIESPYLRATLAVFTVLVPVSGLESLDSGSYVSWYMLFATFWILLWRPATTWGAGLAGLFVLAAALSNPGVWFFIPVAALRAIAIRDRRDGLIVAAFALGALIQIPVAASNHEQVYHPTWTSDILTAYLQRVLDGAAFGQHLGGLAWAHLGWTFLALLSIVAIVALAIGAWHSNRGGRYLAAIAVFLSLAMFFVSLYQRAVGTEMVWPGGTYNGSGGRYVIIPALLLVSAAVVLVDRFARQRRRPRWAAWSGAALIVLLIAGMVSSFDMEDVTARGAPTWDQSLEAAARTCVAERTPEGLVEVSPAGAGFVVELPCAQISSLPGSD